MRRCVWAGVGGAPDGEGPPPIVATGEPGTPAPGRARRARPPGAGGRGAPARLVPIGGGGGRGRPPARARGGGGRCSAPCEAPVGGGRPPGPRACWRDERKIPKPVTVVCK